MSSHDNDLDDVSNPLDDGTPEKKRGITRRDVMTASAWAAPVVALAIASPGASASGSKHHSVIVFNRFDAKPAGANRTATFAVKFPRLLNPDHISLASVVVTLSFSQLDFTGAFTFTAVSGWSGPTSATSSFGQWHVQFSYTGVVAQGSSTPDLAVVLTPRPRAKGPSLLSVTAVGTDSTGESTVPTADVATTLLP